MQARCIAHPTIQCPIPTAHRALPQIFLLMLRTRPSCPHTTDTTVVYTPQIHYRHDRHVQDGRVCYGHDRRSCILWTRPSCILHKSTIDTTVAYVTDTTAARWRHTPTKLLPLTSPNPNPNLTLTLNPNPKPEPYLTLTLTLTVNPNAKP